MSEAQNSKMMSLQILRAIAVLLVMFAHSSEQINGNTIISKQAGNFGVDVFCHQRIYHGLHIDTPAHGIC